MQGARRIITQSHRASCYDPRHRRMNARRVVWFGVSLLAVASWFSSASTPSVSGPHLPQPTPAPLALDRSAAAMQSEVARLHERLAPLAQPLHSRDLFRFNERRLERPAPPAPVETSEQPEPVKTPAQPVLQLIGIAEDESPDGTVRTAIVSGLGDVYLVKAGEVVAGQFRVERVSADAVLLTDTTTAATTILALR